jgi:hypothetical protein
LENSWFFPDALFSILSFVNTAGHDPGKELLPSEQETFASLSQLFSKAEIRRLPVTAFPKLPEWAVELLEARECEVPQSEYVQELHNVIVREFIEGDHEDWAVLCSVGGGPVFWCFEMFH